jgi:hypothetical protein
MADYKILVGTELDTKGLNKQVKDYKGDINVGVNPESVKSGIDIALKGYTAAPIEVGSTLNTQGITDAITKYSGKENRKKVKVGIDPNHLFDGVETIISNKTFKTPLKVNVDLNWTGVAGQIANPDFGAAGAPKFKLDVELDDDAFLQALEKYKNNPKAKEVPFRVKPTMSPDAMNDIEAILETYEAKTPLKVKLKLNKNEINKDIADYNKKLVEDSGKKIIFNATLRANAIDDAITNFKTKYPDRLNIPIDFKVNSDLDKNTEFDAALKKKIEAYENMPVWVSAKLKPASKGFKDQISNVKVDVTATLTNADAINKTIQDYSDKPLPVTAKLVPAANYDKEITKTPVQIQAELAPEALNNAITNPPKALSKLPIGVSLQPKDVNDINSQVKQLQAFATEKLNVGVKLDDASINTDITSFKPTSKLEIQPDLVLENVDEQIKAYTPKVPVRVQLKIEDSDIDEKAGKPSSQEPIQVNVDLNREDIIKQINDFKTDAKVKVGVQLDFRSHKDKETKEYIQKGIAQQIKEYDGKTKLKVGVELDRNSINEEIGQVSIDTPIRLGVELDPNGVQNVQSQIDDLRHRIQDIGDIRINLVGNTGDTGNVVGANGGNSAGGIGNIARQFMDVDIRVDDMVTHVNSLRTALNNLGFNNNTVDTLTADFDELGVSVTNVATRLRRDGSVTLTVRGVDQYERAVTLMRQVNSDGTMTNLGSSVSQSFNETEIAFNRLKTLAQEMRSLDIQIEGLDRNSAEAIELNNQLNRLGDEYIDLYLITERNLSTKQFNALQRECEKTTDRLAQIRARHADTRDELARGISVRLEDGSFDSQIARVQNGINGLVNVSSDVQRELDNVRMAYRQMEEAYANDDMESLIAANERYEQSLRAVRNQLDINKTSNTRDKQALNILGGLIDYEFDNQVDKINKDFKNLSTQSDDARTAVAQLNKALADMENAANSRDIDGLIRAHERYAESLKAARNQIVMQQRSEKDIADTYKDDINELQSVSDKIEKIRIKIANLGKKPFSSNEINVLTNDLQELEVAYHNLYAKLQGGLSPSQLSSLGFSKSVPEARKELDRIAAQIEDIKEKAANAINLKLVNSDSGLSQFDNEIDAVAKRYSHFANMEIPELQAAMNNLEVSFNKVKEASKSDNYDELIQANKEYEAALKAVKAQLDINERAERQANDEVSFNTKKEAALLRIKGLFEQGSEAARVFSEKANRLEKELNECGKANIDNIIAKIKNLGREVNDSHLRTKKLSTGLKEQFDKYRNYFSVASLFMYAEQGLRDMFEQVKLIDSAMTELKKVTNETDASYNQFLKNAASRAKELGTTIDGLVSSTADFARLGYGFQDAQGLAEVANIYAVVGDEIESVEDATQSLISTLAAFKDEMNGMDNSEFAMSIVDKMNEVANNYAISSGGLGQALQRSASSMAAANNSLDETIAMITAAM